VRVCLSIRLERLRRTQKGDEGGPLSIQSSLGCGIPKRTEEEYRTGRLYTFYLIGGWFLFDSWVHKENQLHRHTLIAPFPPQHPLSPPQLPSAETPTEPISDN